jgi:O-antigen ligase
VSLFLSNTWDIILYLSVLLLGLLNSSDLQNGLSVIETNFSVFAIPLIVAKVENFDKKKLYQLFYTLTFGLVVASLICLVNALVQYMSTNDIHVFLFYTFLDILDFQPTYFGYYLITAITFGLYLLFFEGNQTNYRLILTVEIFLFFTLMLTGSITSFISALFVFAFFVLKFFTEDKTRVRKVTFAVVAVMLITMFVFNYLYKQIDSDTYRVTDYWERIELWKSALEANSNFLFGVGTGDYKNVMNQFYVEHHMNAYAAESYNAHNQYIQILFSNGIFGLIALLFILARPLYLSVRCQNILGALVFFPFLVYGMTEVFLGRFQGIVFFVLIHQIFIKFYITHKAEKLIRAS